MNYYFRLAKDERMRIFLPFYINSYCSCFEQGETHYKKGTPYHHLILALDGEMLVNANGKEYVIKENDIFFYKANTSVSYVPNKQCTTCWISFEGLGCRQLFEYYNLSDYAVFNNEKVANELKELCALADKEMSDERLSTKLYSLLVTFCVELKENNMPYCVEKAISYIKKNFSRDISVKEIAQKAEVSVTALYGCFNEYVGITPLGYLNALRIEWATHYLQTETALSVEQIGEMCGFSSTSYFIKCFKNETGTTPHKFRKKF